MDAATRALVEQVEQLADDRIARNAEIKRLREQIAGMVPCDDAAIERAALALLVASTANAHYPGDQWDAVSAGAQDEMREWARAALRAAGETP